MILRIFSISLTFFLKENIRLRGILLFFQHQRRLGGGGCKYAQPQLPILLTQAVFPSPLQRLSKGSRKKGAGEARRREASDQSRVNIKRHCEF